MNLSNTTLAILKNFGTINSGIQFKQGTVLRTVSPQNQLLAEATIEETIPQDFAIYDLNNFLSVISLHKNNPTFEFDQKHVYIVGQGGRSKISYRFCMPSMIIAPPEGRSIKIENPEVVFNLPTDDFEWILKASSVLSSPNIAIKSDGTRVCLVTFDSKKDDEHTESFDIGEGNGKAYNVILSTDLVSKILPGGYTVSVSSKGVASFQNTERKLQYWISVEKGSKFS